MSEHPRDAARELAATLRDAARALEADRELGDVLDWLLAREEAERERADEERQLRNTAIAEWYADAAQMEKKLARCEATLEAIREGVRNPTMGYETVRISRTGIAALSAREPGKAS